MVDVRNAKDLTASLEHDIRVGRLAPGDRLDPVRPAAEALGLAPNTVAAAYRDMARRGLLRSEGRRGTFVAARPPITQPIGPSPVPPVPEGLTDLASGNPDPRLLPDLAPVLASISTEPVLYGQPQVDRELVTALAPTIAADLPHLLPTSSVDSALMSSLDSVLTLVGGALDGLERALSAHLRPGDRVAVEDPAYTSVLDLVAAMGLTAIPVAIDRSGPTPEALERVCDQVSAVVVTPRAQNPTGAALDVDRASALAGILAARPEVLIIEDDHAGPVAGPAYRSAIPEQAERWAVVRSVAKSLGPDLRLAALVGDETTVARVAGRQALGTGWVSHLLQRVVLDLLRRDDIDDALEAAAETYRQRRSAFTDRLRSGGLDDRAAAWLDARSGLNVWIPVDDEAQVVAGMQQRGYAIRSGARFRIEADPAVRISIASTDPDTLVDAADALLEVLGASAPSRAV